MSVVSAPPRARAPRHSAHEIVADLQLLRDWSTPEACMTASAEVVRVRRAVEDQGVASRSASRIASALARYAFLTEDSCGLSRRTLWRLYAVDGIPSDILAGLTWQQLRPRLREIAVPGVAGTRYFDLSGESSRLVMLLRERAEKSGMSSRVFTHRDGQPWASECLAEALALISARS